MRTSAEAMAQLLLSGRLSQEQSESYLSDLLAKLDQEETQYIADPQTTIQFDELIGVKLDPNKSDVISYYTKITVDNDGNILHIQPDLGPADIAAISKTFSHETSKPYPHIAAFHDALKDNTKRTTALAKRFAAQQAKSALSAADGQVKIQEQISLHARSFGNRVKAARRAIKGFSAQFQVDIKNAISTEFFVTTILTLITNPFEKPIATAMDYVDTWLVDFTLALMGWGVPVASYLLIKAIVANTWLIFSLPVSVGLVITGFTAFSLLALIGTRVSSITPSKSLQYAAEWGEANDPHVQPSGILSRVSRVVNKYIIVPISNKIPAKFLAATTYVCSALGVSALLLTLLMPQPYLLPIAAVSIAIGAFARKLLTPIIYKEVQAGNEGIRREKEIELQQYNTQKLTNTLHALANINNYELGKLSLLLGTKYIPSFRSTCDNTVQRLEDALVTGDFKTAYSAIQHIFRNNVYSLKIDTNEIVKAINNCIADDGILALDRSKSIKDAPPLNDDQRNVVAALIKALATLRDAPETGRLLLLQDMPESIQLNEVRSRSARTRSDSEPEMLLYCARS